MIASTPPPTPEPTSATQAGISRRNLFRLSAASAMLAASPLAARGFGSGFTHSIASGEPSQSSVLLWTRYVAEEETKLTWEVSASQDFARPVAQGEALASSSRDFCAKATATGLEPDRWYFYRFVAPDGSISDVGRTRTLPEAGVSAFRMAVFSCSNLGFGYFNAYAHAADVNDVDLALHLGDYIYEYQRGAYPSLRQAHPERGLWPVNETVTLADYRLRYATYRADPDLRRLHQMVPMISVWDDHESTNDSWMGGAQNHQPETEGDWQVRKEITKRVYREWMPVSDEPYARYDVGDLATLFRLDTRLEGREEQFHLGRLIEAAENPQAAMQALAAFREGQWTEADRQLLGKPQEAWLAEGLAASKGEGKIWQVLVQQVLMGKLYTPPSIVDGLTDDAPGFVRRRTLAAAMSSEAGLPANMDAWDGYPAARDRVFEAALNADANLIVLTGDTHNAWGFELAHGAEKVGVEIGVTSVSSPGLENNLRAIAPADFARAALDRNEELVWADTAQRGYAMVELSRDKAVTEHRFTENVRSRSAKLVAARRLETSAGSHTFSL
ncbi:alkaline phosphatase D family protein [Erythrobacter sp. HA6-11]